MKFKYKYTNRKKILIEYLDEPDFVAPCSFLCAHLFYFYCNIHLGWQLKKGTFEHMQQ